MSKKLRCPKPDQVLQLEFEHYGKGYWIEINLFDTDKKLNRFFDPSGTRASFKNGVYAFASFMTPTKENKNFIGEIAFSKENLYASIISHEVTHIVFHYFDFCTEKKLVFTGRRREESFCRIQEALVRGIIKYMEDNDIPIISENRAKVN